MRRRKPYIDITPNTGLTCPDCGKEINKASDVRFVDNSFSYSGTHCTYGRDGVHDPGSTIECVECDCDEFTEDDFEIYEDWGE